MEVLHVLWHLKKKKVSRFYVHKSMWESGQWGKAGYSRASSGLFTLKSPFGATGTQLPHRVRGYMGQVFLLFPLGSPQEVQRGLGVLTPTSADPSTPSLKLLASVGQSSCESLYPSYCHSGPLRRGTTAWRAPPHFLLILKLLLNKKWTPSLISLVVKSV